MCDELRQDRIRFIPRNAARPDRLMAATVFRHQRSHIQRRGAVENGFTHRNFDALLVFRRIDINLQIALRVERIHHKAVTGVNRFFVAKIDYDRRTFDPRVFLNMQLRVFSVSQEQVNAFFHVRTRPSETLSHNP